MSHAPISSLAGFIESLPDADQALLYHELADWITDMRRQLAGGDELMDDLRERRFSGGPKCPRCESGSVYRWGRRNRRQRYRCRACERTFTDLTGTPFAHSRKRWERWVLYAELMLAGTSIRQSAYRVGISIGTAFRWRHAIQSVMGVRGVVEHLRISTPLAPNCHVRSLLNPDVPGVAFPPSDTAGVRSYATIVVERSGEANIKFAPFPRTMAT